MPVCPDPEGSGQRQVFKGKSLRSREFRFLESGMPSPGLYLPAAAPLQVFIS